MSKALLILTACFFTIICAGQIPDKPFIKSLSGSVQLHVDSVAEVYDGFFYDTAMASRTNRPYYEKNVITLRINEDTTFYLPSKFKVTIPVEITITKYRNTHDSVVSVINKDLVINYDSAGQYNSRYSFVFDSAQRVKVKITGSPVTTLTTRNVLPAVILENEVIPYTDYTFSCEGKPVKTLTLNTDLISTNGEVTIQWSNKIGIDEYELEWSYIETTALLNGMYGDTSNLNLDLLFRNNATRIATSDNQYSIPLVFPDEGTLFARVRPVQKKIDGTRLTTHWSTDYTGGLVKYIFLGHQKNINWQSSVSFAEDGKRKVVVQYYDGSLRGRQTVTKDNKTNTTIVAETYYDYQGRPAIQVLPSPTLNTIIQYTKNFNQGVNGGEYDKGLYDTLLSPVDFCSDTVSRMGTASGAAYYYSPQNILPGQTAPTGNNRFIPNANGYAFTQTVYTQDNTGRIAKQSGVGASFKLGSGHETKYYYATPDQNELDALFGTEVGDKNHYFKNAVKDANGQFSVSYVDMHGRTIATALAGKYPASLDSLSSYQPSNITETISDAESNTIKDNVVMESKKSLLVTSEGKDYSFRYKLDPQSLSLMDCNNNNICYDCYYDLQITITDDCNNQKLPGAKPYILTVPHLSLNALDTICNGQVYDTTFTLTNLASGNYEITKRLTVSEYGKNYYRDSIFLKHNTCKTIDNFININRALYLNSQCTPNCDSCRIKVGSIDNFRNSYVNLAGIEVSDSSQYRIEIVNAYNDALAACDALCGITGITYTEDKRHAMLNDISAPFGQYANPDSTADIYSIYHAPSGSSTPRYQLSNIIYYDETGKVDKVYDDEHQDYRYPNELDPTQFALKFKSAWATSLLPYHPEYCKLLKYESYKNSFDWDKGFEGCDNYALAVSTSKNYLDPLGSANTNKDPVYNLDATVRSLLQSQLNAYTSATVNGTNYNISLETFAALMVGCDGSNTTCKNDFIQNQRTINSLSCDADKDKAWQFFRNMYETAKKHLIDSVVSRVTQSCVSGISSVPTPAQIFAAHRSPQFFIMADINSQTQFDNLSAITDPQVLTDSAKIRMRNGYDSNCVAYSGLWLSQLKNCPKYSETEIKNVIIPRLVQVCIKGSDVSHPYGSSTISPDSTNQFSSFEAVIDNYNSTHSYTKTEFCNADLITKPDPYDKQTIYANMPIDTKPDQSTCDRINQLHNEYLGYASGTYTSFSDFMKKHYQTDITDADLTQLLNSCSTTGTCKYLSTPIILPPVLQPNTTAGCVGCSEVYGWYQSFKSLYNNFEPTPITDDTATIRRNNLFVSYMDNHLGFHKETYEYLQYINRCLAAANNNPQCVSCDSLQNIVSQYFDTLTVSGGSETEMLRYIDSTLAHRGLHTTIDAIKQSLDNCGNGWQQNVALKVGKNGGQVWVFNSNTKVQGCSNFSIGKNGAPFTMELWSIHTSEIDAFTGSNFHGIQPLLASSDINFWSGLNDTAHNGLLKGYRLYWQFGKLYLEMGDDQKVVWIRTVQNVSYDTWHHVVVERTGNDSSGIKIYIDNVLYNTEVYLGYSALQNGDISVCGKGLLIGNQSYDGGWGATSPFLKDLRIYARVLSENEIAEDYNNCGISSARTDSLRLWAKMNEGSGGISDFSSYVAPGHWQTFFGAPTNTKSWWGGQGPAKASTCILHYENVLCNFPVSDTILLCGNTRPVLPPADPNIINNCSDSAFYAMSIGTEQYLAYADSIKNNFDSLYGAKCLQAYKYETFTVTHSVAEYHYTLYYYDQAGNLVKTVPPQGVHPNRDSVWLLSVRTARKNGTTVMPAHYFITQYRYNTLNQVVAQLTPDAGKSSFFYDRLGRLVVSQNAKQKPEVSYSYTFYDYLGRINEVGQLYANDTINNTIARSPALLQQWFANIADNRDQITVTTYDEAYWPIVPKLKQSNLRNRVSWSAVYGNGNDVANLNYTSATFYSYDIHGNVDTLLQDYRISPMKDNASNRFKEIVYDYDLISGKVNKVAYQPGYADAFYHKYEYDAENRLTDAYTSRDNIYWEHDAFYQYYGHGPLLRVTLGTQQVQGIDYAYTLQGWLKGVNSTLINSPVNDMGNDGAINSNNHVGRDVYGFALHYYGDADYQSISTSKKVFADGYASNASFKPLYNGNIAAMSVNINIPGTNATVGGPQLNYYNYDQLNRLTKMLVYRGLSSSTNTWTPVSTNDFKENIAYDANGNILKYLRNGTPSGKAMDSLNYSYYYYSNTGARKEYNPATVPNDAALLTNKLAHIDDAVNSTNFVDTDIDDQDTANYHYDEIGNLIDDKKEGINSISWTVYGKIKSIAKSNGDGISYTYDAGGNRISKEINGNTGTWYVRDASGNVMSVYTYIIQGGKETATVDVTQTELYLYGSSRLGVYKPNLNANDLTVPGVGVQFIDTFTRGLKFFELSNHLGNVLVTVSDKKIGVSSNGTTVNYYKADIVTANDYYPFGMVMPGRSYSSGSLYRYGFNGKENDNEVKGTANQQDYGMRIYDPRMGRFLSVDPITKQYPELTPYQFASNSPILGIDKDGLEFVNPMILARKEHPILMGAIDGLHNFCANTWNAVKHPIQTVGNTLKFIEQAGLSMSTVKIVETPMVDAKVDEVINDVIRGNSYSRTKYFTEFGANALTAYAGSKGLGALKDLAVAKYMSGTFIIGAKTLTRVTAYLDEMGFAADEGNKIMLSRMEKIAKNEMKATEIDINFAKHELREAELMKGGKVTYEEAHHAVLKEQGMGGMNVSEYQKKLYTQEALDASDAAWEKEIKNK